MKGTATQLVHPADGITTIPMAINMATKTMRSMNQKLVQMLASETPANTSVRTINFVEKGFPEYKDHFAILIDNLFSKSESKALLECAEASASEGWEQAMVNIGNGRQKMVPEVRLCDRILWDDRNIAAEVLKRVTAYLPADIITLKDRPLITGPGPMKRKETWRVSRLNERLRFLKYTQGNYFRPHTDGSYISPDRKEITFLTVHLYLNGTEEQQVPQEEAGETSNEPLVGGATRFFSQNEEKFWDVSPNTGSVLVFQHRNLLHSGQEVEQGTKYTMRSDILYQKV